MMRAPARVIGPETALVAQPLVHDDAHATSSAPSRPGPLRGGPDSGAGTAQWARQVSKTEEISPDTMQCNTEGTPETHRKHAKNTSPSHGFLETPTPPRL